jgi:hypothetical protein
MTAGAYTAAMGAICLGGVRNPADKHVGNRVRTRLERPELQLHAIGATAELKDGDRHLVMKSDGSNARPRCHKGRSPYQ